MSSRNWLLEPMESRGDQLRKLHRHEASWEGWSEALSLPWQTRCAGQILLVPWFCLSPANTTLWRTLAFHWADHRMLLHRFLPLWNSLRFNFLVSRIGRRALDVNHVEEYLWLKAAAKNDQYKAGLNLTRVIIQLWCALQNNPVVFHLFCRRLSTSFSMLWATLSKLGKRPVENGSDGIRYTEIWTLLGMYS